MFKLRSLFCLSASRDSFSAICSLLSAYRGGLWPLLDVMAAAATSTADEAVCDGLAVHPVMDRPASGISGFLANVRSLPQASGDMCTHIAAAGSDFFALTETHLKDDPAWSLIPRGYKCVARLDRTKKGGGLLMGVKQHLLA